MDHRNLSEHFSDQWSASCTSHMSTRLGFLDLQVVSSMNRGGHFFKNIKLCMWKDCLVNSRVTYQSKTRPEGLLLCFSFCIHPRTSSKGTLMLDHSTLTGSRKCRPTIYCQISILPAVLAFVASISRPLILQARFAGRS